MNEVCYGLIGAGVIANQMARAFTEGRNSTAVALADVNTAAADRLAIKIGVKRVYSDYRQLLADPDVDAVYIATPPYMHRAMTIDALRAGKHVCCEKPFMLSQSEVREVMAVQRDSPQLKVNCASSRYHAADTAKRARAIVAAGDLGDLYHVSYRQVIPAQKVGAKLPSWRNNPAKNGGGISFDWGPYDLDWLNYVLGRSFRPRVVFGTMGNYFPLTPERVPPCLDVDGHYCAQIICEGNLSILWQRRSAEHGPAYHTIELRGTRAGLNTYFMPMADKPGMQQFMYIGTDDLKTTVLDDSPPNWEDATVYPIRDLSAAIIENRFPSNTLADNLRIHGVLDALLTSSQLQQSVSVRE